VLKQSNIKVFFLIVAMFRGKSGESSAVGFIVIIEVILIITLTIAFGAFYLDVKENTLFAKSHVARDISLLMETAQSVPGDVEVYYSEQGFDVGQFNYRFDMNLVQIYDEDPLYSIMYPYYLDTRWEDSFEDYEFSVPQGFVISNVKDSFIIREYGTMDMDAPDQITCPGIVSTKLGRGSFVVVVVEDTNTVLDGIADYFIDYERLTYDKKQKSISYVEETSNLVLVLDVGKGDDVSIHVGDEQSEKIGCLIGNSIASVFSDVDLEEVQLSTDNVLTTNIETGLAVRLIIGEEILTDASSLGSLIVDGVEQYYE
jgi:hypothetical protein